MPRVPSYDHTIYVSDSGQASHRPVVLIPHSLGFTADNNYANLDIQVREERNYGSPDNPRVVQLAVPHKNSYEFTYISLTPMQALSLANQIRDAANRTGLFTNSVV